MILHVHLSWDLFNNVKLEKHAKQAELNKEIFKDYIAQNEAFLAKNKEKTGVTVTASGLAV